MRPTRLARAIAATASLALALAAGCGSSPDAATEEQKKDPAWIQAKLREMDKGLTPDKPIKTPAPEK